MPETEGALSPTPRHAARMARFDACPLYVVITEEFCRGRAAEEVLRASLDGGARLIQFREKAMEARALFHRAEEFRRITDASGALLIIDDRLDVALACGADGVHLGQSDLPIAAARAVAPELILGASTHSVAQALEAEAAGASYVNIGPIFSTQTKQLSMAALGPEALEAIGPRLRIPFTCMGGIKRHNAGALVARGARHLAVVTEVTTANDPAAAVRAMLDVIAGAR